MSDVDGRFGQTLNWHAIQHNVIDYPHIHVIVSGTGKDRKTGQDRSVIFHTPDFAYICERGRMYSEYVLQAIMMRRMQLLDQYDMTSSDVLL